MIPTISIDEHEVIDAALQSYHPTLVREVAERLLKPRSHWPTEDLIDRCLGTLLNGELIERRLTELDHDPRLIVTLISRSQQSLWHFGNLIELAVVFKADDPLKTILALLEGGLLYPVETPRSLQKFDSWLAVTNDPPLLMTHPMVMRRAGKQTLTLPDLPKPEKEATSIQEADGLEWPLKLAALWQITEQAHIRRTQSGDFFKRDHQRLNTSELLNAPPADTPQTLPDPAFLAISLAAPLGMIRQEGEEIYASNLPEEWNSGLCDTIESLWQAWLLVRRWHPEKGWQEENEIRATPYPSASLLLMLLLADLKPEEWLPLSSLASWIQRHHPYWADDEQSDWIQPLLAGLAAQLRLVRLAKGSKDQVLVQLTDYGRWLFDESTDPPEAPEFPQSLMVQPNLEIVAYRQGLTPSLIVKLTRLANWKSVGVACALQLDPERTYRALEMGESLESILSTLQEHGAMEVPSAVVSSIETWARKRDRIRAYPAATLLEVHSPEQLQEALARGVVGVPISDRLLLVPSESDIDFSHFRILSTRDYAARPEQCVAMEEDGITLTVDLKRSDLLVESEIERFARMMKDSNQEHRRYRITPTSMSKARELGLSLSLLESWFIDRVGEPISPAATLLFSAAEQKKPELKPHLVLHLSSEMMTDGVMQWPPTSALIQERLGPTAVSVREEDRESLCDLLSQLGFE